MPKFPFCGPLLWASFVGLFTIHSRPFLLQGPLSDQSTKHGGDRTEINFACQNFQQLFTGSPIHIKHVFKGVPRNSNEFASEYTESPSLNRSTRKSGTSPDPNIYGLISSVSGQDSSVDVFLMHSDFFCRPLFDAIRALLWISGA